MFDTPVVSESKQLVRPLGKAKHKLEVSKKETPQIKDSFNSESMFTGDLFGFS